MSTAPAEDELGVELANHTTTPLAGSKSPDVRILSVDAAWENSTAASASGLCLTEEEFLASRDEKGWGARHKPPIPADHERRRFVETCKELKVLTNGLDEYCLDGQVTPEGAGTILEIEALLDEMYVCHWGEEECVKRIVVAIQSQIGNAQWTAKHVDFMKSAMAYLQVRAMINEATVGAVLDMIEEHDLDVFRGTVSEPDTVVKYRLEKVGE